MALHNYLPCPGYTENLYKVYKDGADTYNRYQRNGLRLALQETPLHYTESAASDEMPPHVFINGIIVPENRELLDPARSVCNPIKRFIPEAGNLPYRNMNKTVKGIQKLGDRVCTVDRTASVTMVYSRLQSMSTSSGYPTITYDLFNKYPAGAPLTKAEIDALKKNRLRPCIGYHSNRDDIIDKVNFSNGVLCTGYVQLLDDALQLFKSYIPALIGKPLKYGDGPIVYPRRIVYDPSKLVKSCSNPVINEAAQIALECDIISSKGDKFVTGLFCLSNPSVCTTKPNPAQFTADDWAVMTVLQHIMNSCLTGNKAITALALITSCYFFSEDLEAQGK